MEIQIENAVYSSIPARDVDDIYPAVSWPSFYMRKKMVTRGGKSWFRMIREPYTADAFVNKRGSLRRRFHTGLIHRLSRYCKDRSIPLTFDCRKFRPIDLPPDPRVEGITFREDQKRLIKAAARWGRGTLQAPTGTGKTILQLGIVSLRNDLTVLMLAHTVDLVNQTYGELLKYGFKDVQKISGGEDRTLWGRIVVSTVQSFVKIPVSQYDCHFDMIIVDEVHHVSSTTGQYGNVLSSALSPLRFGFTATLPTDPSKRFPIEGLIGGLIGKVSIQEGAKLGILAKPRIRLLKTPFDQRIKKTARYADVYKRGIVENRRRNEKIAQAVHEYVKDGKTVLVMVTKLKHGENLEQWINHYGVQCCFVRGQTSTDVRTEVKEELTTRRRKCVIATVVWREGINIPSLDVVVNACGGKSEIMTLQAIGRGLRVTDDKKEVVIVDFFDPSHQYLISHFGERVTLYMNNGWL